MAIDQLTYDLDEFEARQQTEREFQEELLWFEHERAALGVERPAEWSDLCDDCGYALLFVKPVPCGELYRCKNCGLEVVRPLPFTEPMPELTEAQYRALYQGGGNE